MRKVIVITGGARGIGKEMVAYFKKQDWEICIIDVLENDYFVGDISKEEDLVNFHKKVISQYGKIDYLVNNAMISRGGLNDCSYNDFMDVLKVGVLAPFMLVKLFMNDFNDKGAIVNISSSRAFMSQSNTEAYTAAKGGITALTHGMAVTSGERYELIQSVPDGSIKVQRIGKRQTLISI